MGSELRSIPSLYRAHYYAEDDSLGWSLIARQIQLKILRKCEYVRLRVLDDTQYALISRGFVSIEVDNMVRFRLIKLLNEFGGDRNPIPDLKASLRMDEPNFARPLHRFLDGF